MAVHLIIDNHHVRLCDIRVGELMKLDSYRTICEIMIL